MTDYPPWVQEAYVHHRHVVLRRCVGLLKDPSAAEDATHDVFLKLAMSAAGIRDSQALLGWLLATATNHCLGLLRSGKRTTPTGEQPATDGVNDDPSYRLTGELEARDLSRKLLAEMGDLSREVVLSVHADGEERQDVARSLSISRKTVTRKLQRTVSRASRLIKK